MIMGKKRKIYNFKDLPFPVKKKRVKLFGSGYTFGAQRALQMEISIFKKKHLKKWFCFHQYSN